MTNREGAYLVVTGVLALAVAFALLWRSYSLLAQGGVDARVEFFAYVFVKYPWASIPAMFALLGLGVWFDWRHYRRTGALAALTPFRAFAAVTAIAIFIWVNVNGI